MTIIDIDYDYRNDSNFDPDTDSKKLKETQISIYKKALPCDKNICFNLELTEDNYLLYNDMRLGSDTITQIYSEWHRNYYISNLLSKVKERMGSINFEEIFAKATQTIGGHIIFPSKREISINTHRKNPKELRDRFDLTLECIRRFYEEKNSFNPLDSILSKNSDFFALFKNFKSYIDFFYLNPLIDENYKIKCFISRNTEDLKNGRFPEDGFPADEQEWFELYINQLIFVAKRNEIINQTFNLKNLKD